MIIDGIPAEQLATKANFTDRAITSFIKFIERKLNVSVIKNIRGLPDDPALFAPLRLARMLQDKGIIKSSGRTVRNFPDEPRLRSWYAICNDSTSHQVGGTTWDSDADALYAALAEGLERYIWLTQDDFFIRPTKATTDGIRTVGSFIAPEKIAGFSEEQRANNPELQLHNDTEYLWIQATSLTKKAAVYIPAQVVNRAQSQQQEPGAKEPLIRRQTTIGLATWPTQTGARLAGAQEVIEREAYMVMWLNQLTLPRLSLAPLCARDPSLARIIASCERYGLKTHVIQMLTDAPTHAFTVVMEDTSNIAPRFTFGLKAHRNPSFAIQKAMTEALRAHRGCRLWFDAGNSWDMKTPASEVGHRERLYYWSMPEHAKKLEFLIQGPLIETETKEWESDTEEQNLQRILSWCAEKELECISVSLGTSAKNPTPWHVEMVIMPELQPTYLTESTQAFGGNRWREVPILFGYSPRDKPFADEPHPFS